MTGACEVRNSRGTVVATIHFRDELPPVDWLTLKGRSFFWEPDQGAFVEPAEEPRFPDLRC